MTESASMASKTLTKFLQNSFRRFKEISARWDTIMKVQGGMFNTVFKDIVTLAPYKKQGNEKTSQESNSLIANDRIHEHEAQENDTPTTEWFSVQHVVRNVGAVWKTKYFVNCMTMNHITAL